MSDQTANSPSLSVRVIEVDVADEGAPRSSSAPQIIPTERTERVTPSEPAPVVVRDVRDARDQPRRRDRVMSFGLAGVAMLFAGWLVVDAVGWIVAAFERSVALGVLAATAVAAGVGGGGGGGGGGGPHPRRGPQICSASTPGGGGAGGGGRRTATRL